jgi:membrane protein DedA with SNARE-associated domain
MFAMVSRETLMLAALIYTAIGMAFWCFVLIPTGVVAKSFARRGSTSLFWGFRASLAMIVVWPWFAWICWKRRREIGRALKRVWGMR